MTAPYTPPPGILHSIERIGEALGNLRAHSDQTLMSDQESDYQSDQVMRLRSRGN